VLHLEKDTPSVHPIPKVSYLHQLSSCAAFRERYTSVEMRELCPNNFGNNDGVKELSIIPAL